MKTQQFSLTAFACTLGLGLVLAGSAIAQAPQGTVGPSPAIDPIKSDPLSNTFFTVPLSDTDTVIVPIDVHNPGVPFLNWAGVRMKTHILDASEVDVLGVGFAGVALPWTSPGGTVNPAAPFAANPFGPASGNAQSTPIIFTVLDPNWQLSGITLAPSVHQPVFDLSLHAKNTNPINNSDIDITMMFSNIFHVPNGPGSNIIEIFPSWWVFVNSAINDPLQLHATAGSFYQFPGGVDPNTGHWLHFTDTAIFHTDGIGSALVAVPNGGTLNLGIEHVPEPSRAVLLLFGAGAMFMGVRSRRRRKGEEAAA